MRIKRDLMAIFLVQLILSLPFYTSSVYGLSISNVRVTRVSSNSATIEWETDNLSNGRIRYGKTPSLGFTERHDNLIGNHTISLFNGMDSDTSYFFAVESTDLAGSTAIENNSNRFYTFRTTDITPPPQVTGLALLSSSSSSILISWNSLSIGDLSRYLIYRDRVLYANSTTNSFNDTGLTSNTAYSYKISAVDNSGNEGPQSDTLIASTSGVDSIAPVISNVNIIPITDTTARVTWATNENSTSIVLYGINRTDKVKSSLDLEINHTVVIDGLVKNTVHVFVAKSCDQSGNCANSSLQSFTAGRDTKAPFINLDIPRYVNRRIIDIIGATEPFSSVTLFVNNMNAPKRSLSGNEIGSSGKFVFSQIQLEQENVIKIVMVDRSGNKNQKIFEVGIDTEDPIVQLKDSPSLTSRIELPISGFVNEPVTIKAFMDTELDDSVPSKIIGLNATKIGQNSVEIHWAESKDRDFSHYVVYREDASPIAITKPANFNLYIDALVDSGKSYTYQVSSVNIFGREGPKSDPLTVKTLTGGQILNLKPADVDILEDFRKPIILLNTTGAFNFDLKLNRGDKLYKIKLIFEDRAGNTVIIELSVTLDTKKPEIKILSPPSGAMVFENVANEIDIIGQTKPNARVHLFIDRTPFSFYNETFEVSGLPNEVQDLPEAKLDAKCRSSLGATTFCRTGADFSVDADSSGKFKFERVDLTAGIFPPGSGALRSREVPVSDFRDFQLNPEGQKSKRAMLVIIATDKTGKRGVATQTINIGTCWSGNQSWDIIPLTRYQSPTFLSTERLAEGTETLYFYFNYSYIGAGTSAVINGITMSRACGTREVLDPRFNISCQIMPTGAPTQLLKTSINPTENRVSYSAVQLNRFPGMDRFLEDDWKSFFNAINKEMTFPLLVRINYKHDTNNDGILESETQTICEQVSYAVDNTIIDPRKVLPDWLLFDFVDFLQESIKTLTDAQEKLNKLVDYVAIGCFTFGGTYFAAQIYRRWTSFWEEKAYAGIKTVEKLSEMFGLGKIKLNPEKKENEDECQNVINNIVKAKKEFKLKYVNDADLRKCFPATSMAWDIEARSYEFMRYSCDRIFGHASPSRWTESRSDEELTRKAESIEGCAGDGSQIGQPLDAMSCTEFARRYPRYSDAAKLGADKKCVLVKSKTATGRVGDFVFTVGDLVSDSEQLYKLDYIQRLGEFSSESFYAIKSPKSEFKFLTAKSKSCEEECHLSTQGKVSSVDYKTKEVKIVENAAGQGSASPCMTVQDCTSLNSKDPQNTFKLKGKEVKYARNAGFTSDCFYNPDNAQLNNPVVVSSNPSQGITCCCIGTQDQKGQPTNYYQPDDVDPSDPTKKVHESKTKPGEPPQQLPNDEKGYSDMKWSYRYSKEKFQSVSNERIRTQYHPHRYIEDRDFPACFGMDHMFYTAFGEKEKALMLDPAKDYVVATFQCAHLVGISQRLQFIKNLMASLSTCLIQVRTTGRGDAGACKELFTQYLCNSIWQVINFIVSDKCAPTDLEADPNLQLEGLIERVRAGTRAVSDAASDVQNTISGEYGNAKLNELLGTGEESVARKVCLAAFGYDWELNVRNLIDAAYTTPFATLVQPITRSREFLTINPVDLKPKYEYRASWVINPGCDFERYDIELACVGRRQLDTYPNQINCGAVGGTSVGSAFSVGKSPAVTDCDCIGLPDERRRSVFVGPRLKQNVIEDKPAFHQVIDDNFRYDHLKFTLRPDRKIPANIKPNCFPTGYDDGVFYVPLIDKTARDVFDCRLDPLSGSVTPCCTKDPNTGAISCGSETAFASKKGTAEFMDITINGNNALGGREDLTFFSGEILKIDATVRSVGQNKCLRLTLDGQNQVEEVFEGIQQYTIQVQPTFGKVDILEPAGIKVQKINLLNQKEVFINLGFWDADNNQFFFDDDDQFYIGNKNDNRKKIAELKNAPGSRMTLKDGASNVEVSLVNQQLVLVKENAEIVIVSVEPQRNSITGEPLKDPPNTGIPFVQGTIRISQPTDATAAFQPQSSQSKNLIIGLYHTRDDPNVFGISSCNFNDPVITSTGARQERPIRVTIEQRTSASPLQGPIVSGPATRTMLPFKKDNIVIAATITHSDGVETPELDCKSPEGRNFKVTSNFRGSSNYEFYVNPSEINFAGEYSCTLNARSTNKNARVNSIPVRFEVQCGGDNNVYSKCDRDAKCKSGNVEITGLGCLAK